MLFLDFLTLLLFCACAIPKTISKTGPAKTGPAGPLATAMTYQVLHDCCLTSLSARLRVEITKQPCGDTKYNQYMITRVNSLKAMFCPLCCFMSTNTLRFIIRSLCNFSYYDFKYFVSVC